MKRASYQQLCMYAPVLLRCGMAIVFLYFGFSQATAPSDWTGWLPAWTESLPVSQEMFIFMNGWIEIILGTALLIGFATHIAAALLALHLLAITFSLGFTQIGVRDFGLTIATATIAIVGAGPLSIDAWRKRRA